MLAQSCVIPPYSGKGLHMIVLVSLIHVVLVKETSCSDDASLHHYFV